MVTWVTDISDREQVSGSESYTVLTPVTYVIIRNMSIYVCVRYQPLTSWDGQIDMEIEPIDPEAGTKTYDPHKMAISSCNTCLPHFSSVYLCWPITIVLTKPVRLLHGGPNGLDVPNSQWLVDS